jgi:outer membrane scaffolding protein for murein synthesis (MipA/OmpV family)
VITTLLNAASAAEPPPSTAPAVDLRPAPAIAGAADPAVAKGAGPPAAPSQPVEAAEPKDFELALGLRGGYGPEYMGAGRSEWGARPAIYVRYGRFSLSSASGLIDRRDENVLRGLGVDLSRSDTLRTGLSLRYDNGRSDGGSEGLRDVGDVSATVRVRGAVQWRPVPEWRFSAALTPDLFDRGGGTLLEGGVTYEWRPAARTRWYATAGLTWADAVYMQSYFGVDEDESEQSGLPVYRPGSGFRDASLSGRVRHDFSSRWTVSVGLGLTQLLGPARDSPFTEDTLTFGATFGLIYWVY